MKKSFTLGFAGDAAGRTGPRITGMGPGATMKSLQDVYGIGTIKEAPERYSYEEQVRRLEEMERHVTEMMHLAEEAFDYEAANGTSAPEDNEYQSLVDAVEGLESHIVGLKSAVQAMRDYS